MAAFLAEAGWLPLIAAAVAVCCAVIAAIVLARSAEDRDIAGRVESVLRPAQADRAQADSRITTAAAPFRRIGERLRNTALVSDKDIEEFQISIAAAGLNPRAAVPTFIGVKAVLMLGLPVITPEAALAI